MKSKKILLIAALIFLIAPCPCFPGETSIHGTACCYMPQLIGYNTAQKPESQDTQDAQPQAPVPSGASGKAEVQEEEKLIQTEEKTCLAEDIGTQADAQTKAKVYTICAR